MDPTGIDEDGLPTWTCEVGTPLLPPLRAVERLGVGHRTETWLAWSTDLWHPVVVKLARPHQVDHPRAARSLHREVTALAEPGHPALPRLLVDGADDDLPHLVLEYVDGDSLADLVDDHGGLDPDDVAMLGARLLPPLLHLHQRGLAHLDVKTDNVMVQRGRPVLIDCGSAREIGRRQPPGRPVGTAGYAAPELEACEPLTAAMDYFGLGTVLAEALTGRPYPEVEGLPDAPVTPLVEALLADEPARRGTPASILSALERACVRPPWPPGISPDQVGTGSSVPGPSPLVPTPAGLAY